MNKIAYLTSCYPDVSHTFIQREILALRDQGVCVDTFSIRRPDGDTPSSQADRRERANTFYVLPARPFRLLRAHLFALFSRPRRYARTAYCALAMRPAGLRSLVWHIFYLAEAVYFWDEMRRRGIRHFHVHFAMSCASVAMIAHQLGGISYSMTVHGSTVFYNAGYHRIGQKVQYASFVICISGFCRSQVMVHSRPEDWWKLRVIHCGVQIGRDRPPSMPPGHPSEPIHILNVGRLVQVKAHGFLLHAIAEVRKKHYDIRCTIVGDGPCRSTLETLCEELGIRDHVRLVGAVDQDTIHSYYADADLFVLPSLAEGVPVVLMEAMANELPVIATRVMGIPELVEDGVHGRLVPPACLPALVDAIAELADDAQLRHRMGCRGRKKVRTEFDIRRSAQELSRAFAEILQEPVASEGPVSSIATEGEPVT